MKIFALLNCLLWLMGFTFLTISIFTQQDFRDLVLLLCAFPAGNAARQSFSELIK